MRLKLVRCSRDESSSFGEEIWQSEFGAMGLESFVDFTVAGQSYLSSSPSSTSSSPTKSAFIVEQQQKKAQLPILKISTRRAKHTRNRSQTHLRKPASFDSYLSYERANSISSISSCESLTSTNSNNTPVDYYYNHFSSSSSSSIITSPLSPRFISNTIVDICHRFSSAIGLTYFLDSLKHGGSGVNYNNNKMNANISLTEDYDKMDDINTSLSFSRDLDYYSTTEQHEDEEEFLFVNTRPGLRNQGGSNSSISLLT
ncbi:459_t:CDS:2 [Ambispora gerdemannii]|uniref:459_t:CDS:1 n=1 Tax=Ambispora gerdemannii TaxID=144530 RepID=A0A9N9G8N2_9GLOM|nr:459_t:CDS:2 [Ambispora gerdemannii]